nr:RNA-directed DNA polymerase, eukaryota [Tanacetum cinerariifolium]
MTFKGANSPCWIGDSPLSVKFPRLFALEEDKEISVAVKMLSPVEQSFRRNVRGGLDQQSLVEMNLLLDVVSLSLSWDSWFCDLTGDGEFRVKEVNIFAWRARRDCLPTRANLVQRGVNLASIICPMVGLGSAALDIVFRVAGLVFFGSAPNQDKVNSGRCFFMLLGGPFGHFRTVLSSRRFNLSVR